ncbi:hypothetical protein HN832_03900 [archaeon]|jgi:hypothetical protein|nr:hypothetical protein [archaeon]MBT4373462.1 hypothetical protein [archaeon]MBT4531910.1 hypothetical protein [archaeon]MBT7001577.1 hypothetical protein [archaeon]MBT7282531.1 hypothetical protein [archaeon]
MKMYKKPNEYWMEWENVEANMQRVIDDVGYFPKYAELKELKESVICSHFKLSEIREKMGYDSTSTSSKETYWNNPENVCWELRDAILLLGHFPNTVELRELGKGQVSKYFQIGELRELMNERGSEPKSLPRRIIKKKGYWQEWENVEREFRKRIEELGHFPLKREVGDLRTALQYYSLGTIRERLNSGLESTCQ